MCFEINFEMFWDDELRCFEMIWDVVNLGVIITFTVVSYTLHFWDGAYARWDGLDWQILRWRLRLVDASINWKIRFLRWEFCSNGTTCICIVLSRIIWLNHEVYLMLMNEYICCCFMLFTYCDKYYLKAVN